MSLLEHPKAQELPADATLSAAAVCHCRDHLTQFLQRYLPLFYRQEQRELATVVIRGRLSGLKRKTSEPIAYLADRERKPVRHFVGAGAWDDEAVMAGLRGHVGEVLADPRGVPVPDGGGFPKKGTESRGVARQWCGRLGKVENRRVGVFPIYAAPGGRAPLDRRLYLSEDWIADLTRRRKSHVPLEIAFREGWRIGPDLLDRGGPDLPHAWVVGDDEFGRAAEFRAELRLRREHYVLDVPCDTPVREIGAARRPGGRRPPFERADVWAARRPASRWKTITIRAGERGPLKVKALKRRVRTKEDGRVGPAETPVVIRAPGKEPRFWYTVSNARREEPLAELVRAHGERRRVEEVLEAGKGEVGRYEVRGWVGRRHHMTLAPLALWFLTPERRRLGGKNPGLERGATTGGVQPVATAAAPAARADRRGGQSRTAA